MAPDVQLVRPFGKHFEHRGRPAGTSTGTESAHAHPARRSGRGRAWGSPAGGGSRHQDQENAVPAKASNEGSCWGQDVAGWCWRWRCGPVACPVRAHEPDRLPGREVRLPRRRSDLCKSGGEIRPDLAVKGLDREPDATEGLGDGPGSHDDRVGEGVRAGGLGHGDVDGRVVVMGVRGEHQAGAAADREDVAGRIGRRGEHLRRARRERGGGG